MFPSFGFQCSPGDLLSSKSFQKVTSLNVETQSDEKFKIKVQSGIVDPLKLLSGLSDMLECSGQYMAKSILNAEDRFEQLLNFLYSQTNTFQCFGLHFVRKEDESCFEISDFQKLNADMMVSKTVSGTFFLCVLTSKYPVKDIIMKKFDYVLRKFPNISANHCKYFDVESIEVTVFANWNEMICIQKSVGDAIDKMFVYHNSAEAKVMGFEVDDFEKCLRNLPFALDNSFENCYRLMRIIKLKGAEFSRIYDVKKKKSDQSNISRLKTDVEELEKELKQNYFLKLEHIERLNLLVPDVLNFMEKSFQSWLTADNPLDSSLFEMMETCLTLLLTKYETGNCIVRNNILFYNAEDMDEIQKVFGINAFIGIKSQTSDFKQWLDMKFLQMYPLCCIRKWPSLSDSVFLYKDENVYGFGTVTLKKPYRKKKSESAYENFCCMEDHGKYERFWKCTVCNIFVKSDGKNILCECGNCTLDNAELRCALSNGNICNRKPVSSSRLNEKVNKNNANSKENKSIFNIVLFGPVGSGKSTLVNAAMNYMEYASYEYASSRPLIAPIPYNFSFFNENYQEKPIKSKVIPDNCSEDFASESHITQRPTTYEHYSGGKTYRFIDTVGYSSEIKDSAILNLELIRTLKHIDAVWIIVSANQKLKGDDNSWIYQIIKPIPKKLFPRLYFVFTNIQGKHSLRFNVNVNAFASYLSQFKEIPFGENNVFAIENDCLKSLYAQGTGCSLSGVQDSLGKTWKESRSVVLDLLNKAAAPKPPDDDIFFLNNLFYLFLSLKRFHFFADLHDCYTLLAHNFISSKMSNDKPPPSYEDVFKSLISFKSKIPDASPQHKVLIEFIETFEDFIKKQHSSTFGTALGYGKKLFSWLH